MTSFMNMHYNGSDVLFHPAKNNISRIGISETWQVWYWHVYSTTCTLFTIIVHVAKWRRAPFLWFRFELKEGWHTEFSSLVHVLSCTDLLRLGLVLLGRLLRWHLDLCWFLGHVLVSVLGWMSRSWLADVEAMLFNSVELSCRFGWASCGEF